MYTPEPLGSNRERLAGALELGFPAGYFVIRSIATKKVLDVSASMTDDGTEVVLWSEKERSLVQGQINLTA